MTKTAAPGGSMPDAGSLMQHLLLHAPDALLVVDGGGTIRYANETCAALFGHGPRQLVGQPLDLLIPERFRQRHAGLLAGYMLGPAMREMGTRLTDLFARRSDGSEFPAGIRLAPFAFQGASFVAVAVRDMTERRQISSALVAAREEADRANRAKSRFLAAASHDLRQPMQVIRLLNASLLKLVPADAPARELLERQEAAIDSASNLLNALLDVSRLESGAVEPDESVVELAEVFAELRREFEASAHASQLELSFDATSVRLRTDRTMLLQLLQNLIGNALKYTDRGFVRVGQSLAGDQLVLTVEDSGIGIPQDKLAHIFDEYYQVDAHSGAKRPGVGLGLAIVREVARILGFGVTIDSRLAEGTRAQVRIPRRQLLHDEQRRSAVRAAAEVRPTGAAALRSNIVLVEDNASVRAATEMFLGLEGFPVRSAASLEEAMPLIAGMQPGDVLVTDFRFGSNVTGLDVLNMARSRHAFRVPAVLLSGDLDSMLRAIREPPPDCRFLSKPVDVNALLTALADLAVPG